MWTNRMSSGERNRMPQGMLFREQPKKIWFKRFPHKGISRACISCFHMTGIPFLKSFITRNLNREIIPAKTFFEIENNMQLFVSGAGLVNTFF